VLIYLLNNCSNIIQHAYIISAGNDYHISSTEFTINVFGGIIKYNCQADILLNDLTQKSQYTIYIKNKNNNQNYKIEI